MKTETQRHYEQRILRVLVHIQQRLDDALDLDELASLACFSPYHFHRVFRGLVGEPVHEHVRRLRLERAAHRLKSTTQPVTRIALDAGYETHEAFTRAFHAHFNQSPSRFRQLHRAPGVPHAPSGVHYAPDGRVDGFLPLSTGAKTMDVRLEDVEPMRVAFIRHVGPYAQVGQTWQRLFGWAGRRGLLGGFPKTLGICHDDPDVTPADKLRYDACIVVGPSVQAEGEVGVQTVAGGQYAVTTHEGPYERLGETYAALLGRWLPAHSKEPLSAPCFEVYRNAPYNTPPEQLVTDVYVPLKTRTAAVGAAR